MRSDLILAMHIYIPEQTATLAKYYKKPYKHGKGNNNKELYVYWSYE